VGARGDIVATRSMCFRKKKHRGDKEKAGVEDNYRKKGTAKTCSIARVLVKRGKEGMVLKKKTREEGQQTW